MNLVELKDQLLFLVSQWMGTTLPRLAAVLAGILVCLWALQAFWERRTFRIRSLAGGAFGLFLMASGLFPDVLHRLVRITDPLRLRIIVGIISAGVLVVTFESIRRSRLRERYALLWIATGLALLVSALVPASVDFLGYLFGTEYWFTVVGILAAFILLIAFHFSLAFSKHESNQQKLAQRYADIENRLSKLESEKGILPPAVPAAVPARRGPSSGEIPRPRLPGAHVAIALAILISWGGALVTGLLTREPMIGDEVTHFYIMENQAENLGRPVFFARIPVGWGGEEIRRYPHVNAWHYLGAVVYRLSRGSSAAVQLYQSLFWLQFMLAAVWLARRRNGFASHVPLANLLLLASLPAACIFSVAFYQDIPAAAQVLTAFVLVLNGNWLWGAVFFLFALSLKITSFLFIPAFIVAVWLAGMRAGIVRDGRSGRLRALARPFTRALCVAVMIALCSFGWARVLRTHASSGFYPFDAITRTWAAWSAFLSRPSGADTRVPQEEPDIGRPDDATDPAPRPERPRLIVSAYEKEIIANHPGDLRIPRNYLIYGGALIWFVFMAGLAGLAISAKAAGAFPAARMSPFGLLAIGLAYAIPAAYVLRTAPDARFFLPAVPFLMLPFVEWMSRLPRIRVIVTLLAAVALVQTGHVYAKVYRLRTVSGPLREAIGFLRENPPEPHRVFMYPEGHYRLFPVRHDWYLNYWLRDFWRADNDERLEILNRFDIGAMVIKKYLVGDTDEAITDLGIYPRFFVKDIARDARFEKIFENRDFLIYRVPLPPGG